VLHEHSLRVLPDSSKTSRAAAQLFLGEAVWCLGDDGRATAHYREALAYFREIGWSAGCALVLRAWGNLALLKGDLALARQHLLESLGLCHTAGLTQCVVTCLDSLAALAATEGQATRAVTLWTAAEAIRRSIVVPPHLRQRDFQARVDAARAQLDRQAQTAAEAAGQAMSLDQAVAAGLDVAPT